VRFEVLTVVTIKIMSFWDEMACVLVGTKVLEESSASNFLVDTSVLKIAGSSEILLAV
jgi:hypothetical protein